MYKCNLLSKYSSLFKKADITNYIGADYDCCVVDVHFHLDGYQSSGRRYMWMHLSITCIYTVFTSVLITFLVDLAKMY